MTLAPAGPYPRRGDWIDQLAAAVREHLAEPFEWGQHDCLQWASKAVEAMTDVDPLAVHRGAYRSPSGAMRVLRREGVRLPINLADKLWGPRVPIAFARMGDIVACGAGQPADMGPSLGVCNGRGSLFVGTGARDSGLVLLETLSLEHCYQPWASS